MAEPRFTPGPWEWWTSNSWRRLTAHNKPGRQYVQEGDVLCPTVARDGHPDLIVTEANMALIAASPDLYEAVRKLAGDVRETIKKNHKPDCDCHYCFAIAALEKAEGGTR